MNSPKITFDEALALIQAVQKDIDDDFRACEDDEEPGIRLTVGDNCESWGYQTGDNSYTGGAYGYANWAVVDIYRDSDCEDLAKEIIDELTELCVE